MKNIITNKKWFIKKIMIFPELCMMDNYTILIY